MVTTTSTFISVGEEEKHKAYEHTRAGDNEGREDDEAYRGTSLRAHWNTTVAKIVADPKTQF